MIGADLVRAVIVLGFLFVRDAGDLWLLYTLGAAQIAVSAAFTPARDAVLPLVTRKGELLTANALLAATWSIMLAVGAAAGGPVVDAFGTDVVFWLDAGTYVVSAVFIAGIRLPAREVQVDVGGVVRAGLRRIGEGWRYIWSRPPVRRIALAKAAWGVGGGGLVFALAVLGDSLFPSAGTTGIGVLFAARGLGTGIGPIVARLAFRDARRWPLVLAGCIVVSGLGYLAVAALADWRWAVATLVVVAHAASGANWVLSTTLLQERSEDAYRGRVVATDWLLVTLVDSVAIFVASRLLEGGMALATLVAALAAVQVLAGLVWGALVVPAEGRDRGAASPEATGRDER